MICGAGLGTEDRLMHFIIALVMGGLVGWIAGMVMRSDGGVLWNILIGCVGSIVGRALFGALSHDVHLTAHPFNPAALLVAFLGAVVLLGIYNYFTRGALR